MGQVVRFFRPGAKRILCSVSQKSFEATACINLDGTVAVVVLNRGQDPVRFNLKGLHAASPVMLPAHAIATYLFRAQDL